MTLGTFTGHLFFWTGRRDAEYWIHNYGHHQQPCAQEVLQLLRSQGFEIRENLTYQPRWATAWYRLLVSPVVQFLGRHGGGSLRPRLQQYLASHVRASLRETPTGEGACLFVVAARKG
jgi:hypothetical protein